MTTEELYAVYCESGTVSINTRTLAPGSLFFGIRGEKFDGNRFAQEALEKGARLVIVDDDQALEDTRVVRVADALASLQKLAQFHRDQLNIPVIGLTGSNGKTTSKELVRVVLANKFRTFATTGNLNNHLGVPLSILSIDRSVEIAVIEMGANHLGEIAHLCEIANPTHGFITNIGKAHMGTFGGAENVLRAKSELYHHLITVEGTVWINSDDPVLLGMAKRFRKPYFYPGKNDYYHCRIVNADPFLKIETEDHSLVETQLIGSYNFPNVGVALCIGKFFGVDPSKANAAIAAYHPGNMRSEIVRKGTNMIILDAYNANPTSMQLALDSFDVVSGARKVLILGDMFELGEETGNEHQALGRRIAESGVYEVYLCGEAMNAAATLIPGARWFPNAEAMGDYLKSHPLNKAMVLVKGSRGMQLEKVMEYL